jgi:hypothetical protein
MKIYPVRIEGEFDPDVSRGLWLVKWLLAIPHYFVLVFLWLAVGVLSVVAFVAVLFTGRYPRSIFAFTTGVLRWSWRVAFYAYGVLGTDRYPPFTLAEVPDYPARLTIDYPPRLSRGIVLVKWLLAIPHLLVLAVLLGGGPYLTYRLGDSAATFQGGGLIGLLMLIAGVVLLFTGRYPRDLFDLIVGLNRWVYRVAGYVLLLTDEYPPFRLDTGSGVTEPAPTREDLGRADAAIPAVSDRRSTPVPGNSWTAGRVVSVVLGALLVLGGLGSLPTGAVALWYDQTGRDSAGYISTDLQRFSSQGYAISSDSGALRFDGPAWVADHVLGKVRITGTSTTDTPLFIGIATEHDVSAYLRTVEHTVVAQLDGYPPEPVYREHAGQALTQLPGQETFWSAKTSGTGAQRLVWQPQAGDWSIVVLNADGNRPVQADLAIGATFPLLDDLGYSLIALGLILLLVGGLLISLAVRAAHRTAVPASVPPPIDTTAGAAR